jgi:hypothetical protein
MQGTNERVGGTFAFAAGLANRRRVGSRSAAIMASTASLVRTTCPGVSLRQHGSADQMAASEALGVVLRCPLPRMATQPRACGDVYLPQRNVLRGSSSRSVLGSAVRGLMRRGNEVTRRAGDMRLSYM